MKFQRKIDLISLGSLSAMALVVAISQSNQMINDLAKYADTMNDLTKRFKL